MRVGGGVCVFGALLCLRCASFATDDPTPPISDAGSGSTDAAAPSDIEIRPADTTADCDPAQPAVLGMDHDVTDAESDDSISSTKVDAYSYVVVSDAFAQCAHFYARPPIAGPDNAAYLGVYSNDPKGPAPLKLLTRALFPNFRAGWNVAHLDDAIRAPKGTRMWLGLVPTIYNVTIIADKDQKCADARSGGMHPLAVNTPSLPPMWVGENPTAVEPGRCNARFFVSP